MRIHKSDPAYVASRGCKSWQEIMGLCAERAVHRQEVQVERKTFGAIQDAAQESWE